MAFDRRRHGQTALMLRSAVQASGAACLGRGSRRGDRAGQRASRTRPPSSRSTCSLRAAEHRPSDTWRNASRSEALVGLPGAEAGGCIAHPTFPRPKRDPAGLWPRGLAEGGGIPNLRKGARRAASRCDRGHKPSGNPRIDPMCRRRVEFLGCPPYGRAGSGGTRAVRRQGVRGEPPGHGLRDRLWEKSETTRSADRRLRLGPGAGARFGRRACREPRVATLGYLARRSTSAASP
jgi:hypothetical protein